MVDITAEYKRDHRTCTTSVTSFVCYIQVNAMFSRKSLKHQLTSLQSITVLEGEMA